MGSRFSTTLTGERKAAFMRRLFAEGKLTQEDLDEHGVSAESRGLGDTVKKLTDATGLTKLAKAVERVTGKPCRCSKRQAALNAKFPYQAKTSKGVNSSG